MKTFRAAILAGFLVALLASAPHALAQAPAPNTAPAATSAAPAPAVSPTAAPIETAPRALQVPPRLQNELSPWSMFMSADILVKAVMVSLAFASLVTWTIFIAKTLHLWVARRRLRRALSRIEDSRTLSEAQIALGAAEN